jgi:hypothetical protein
MEVNLLRRAGVFGPIKVDVATVPRGAVEVVQAFPIASKKLP